MTDFAKDNRSPSFRGVPFHVRVNEATGGRRNETHEYPGGERPMTEDLGRKARQIQINAFVNGQDWRKQSDALVDALEKKGPGELVHPNGKTYNVCVQTYNMHERHALFEAEFTINFIESGEQPSPMVSISLTDRLLSAAATLDIANAAEFLKIGADYVASNAAAVSGLARSVVDNFSAIIDGVQSAADSITGAIDGIAAVAMSLSDLSDNAQNLLETPGVWTARVKAATDTVIGLLPANKKNTKSVLLTASSGFDASKIDQSNTKGAQEYSAMIRTNNFNLAKAATSAAQLIAVMETDRRGDVREILDAFNDTIDTILGADIAMSPEFTTALSDLSAAASAVCNDVIAQLPEEQEITIPSPVPARVLAHKLYGDQSRYEEIANENEIPNPTFVPSGTILKVLKK